MDAKLDIKKRQPKTSLSDNHSTSSPGNRKRHEEPIPRQPSEISINYRERLEKHQVKILRQPSAMDNKIQTDIVNAIVASNTTRIPKRLEDRPLPAKSVNMSRTRFEVASNLPTKKTLIHRRVNRGSNDAMGKPLTNRLSRIENKPINPCVKNEQQIKTQPTQVRRAKPLAKSPLKNCQPRRIELTPDISTKKNPNANDEVVDCKSNLTSSGIKEMPPKKNTRQDTFHIKSTKSPSLPQVTGIEEEKCEEEKHDPGKEKHDPGKEKHDPGKEKHDTGMEKHHPGREKHVQGREKHDPVRRKCDQGREKHDPGREKHDPGRENHIPNLVSKKDNEKDKRILKKNNIDLRLEGFNPRKIKSK